MSKLISKLAAEYTIDRDGLIRRYRELLRGNDDSQKAVSELRTIIETLGFTPADVEADARAIQAAEDLLKQIEAARGLAAAEAIHAEAIETIQREQQAAIAVFAKRRFLRVAAQSADYERKNEATFAASRLKALIAKHPNAIGGSVVPDVDQLYCDASAFTDAHRNARSTEVIENIQ